MKNKITSSKNFKSFLKKYIKTNEFLENESFRIPYIRDELTKDRFKFLFKKKITFRKSKNTTKQSFENNADTKRMFYNQMSKRPDLISMPLSCMNSVIMNSYKMKVLSIGTRTEAEIFSLVNAGFNLKNIDSIDLISYSPLIKLGDICNIKKKSDSFDLVVCGWTLEFVTNINKAVNEIKRVTKPRGIIAIGGMHHPKNYYSTKNNIRKKNFDRKWHASIENIFKLFGISHKDCLFKSEINFKDKDKRGEVVVIFKNKKG